MAMTEEEILLALRVIGEKQFIAANTAAAGSVERLGVATEETGLAMMTAGRRGFFMNQALFTMRRLTYGVTLGFLAAGAVTVKWGWEFNNTMNTARVALAPVAGQIGSMNAELETLFNLAKFSPFTFQDTTLAFRNMYIGMQTLGISADTVNDTLQALVDSLSAAGRTTPANLNRVAYALQHMAYQGHLTGQVVNQLGRDGIPMAAILRDEFHLTGEEIHNVGKLGIPTLDFLKAFHHWIETNPATAGAAQRQATQSFSGMFAQFKDSMSQIMGQVEKGFFNRAKEGLSTINAFFNRTSDAIRNAQSASDVVRALFPQLLPLWEQISAVTYSFAHNFWNVVHALATSKPLWAVVFLGLVALRVVLTALEPLTGMLSNWLYIIIPLWVAYKVVTTAAAIATTWNTFAITAESVAMRDLTFRQFVLNLFTGKYLILLRLQLVWLAIMEGATWAFAAAQAFLVATTESLTSAVIALGIALELNPIFLIITLVALLAAGLVILYFKWDAFHRLVDRTWNWIVDNKYLVAAAITTAFGPLILVYETLRHIRDIWNSLGRAFHWVGNLFHGGGGGANRGSAGNAVSTYLPSAGKPMPGSIYGGMATGGTTLTPGLSWVGERGPELMSLPAGATVSPLKGNRFNLPEAWMSGRHDGRPLKIQVMINRRILGEVVAEELSLQGARA